MPCLTLSYRTWTWNNLQPCKFPLLLQRYTKISFRIRVDEHARIGAPFLTRERERERWNKKRKERKKEISSTNVQWHFLNWHPFSEDFVFKYLSISLIKWRGKCMHKARKEARRIGKKDFREGGYILRLTWRCGEAHVWQEFYSKGWKLRCFNPDIAYTQTDSRLKRVRQGYFRHSAPRVGSLVNEFGCLNEILYFVAGFRVMSFILYTCTV